MCNNDGNGNSLSIVVVPEPILMEPPGTLLCQSLFPRLNIYFYFIFGFTYIYMHITILRFTWCMLIRYKLCFNRTILLLKMGNIDYFVALNLLHQPASASDITDRAVPVTRGTSKWKMYLMLWDLSKRILVIWKWHVVFRCHVKRNLAI